MLAMALSKAICSQFALRHKSRFSLEEEPDPARLLVGCVEVHAN